MTVSPTLELRYITTVQTLTMPEGKYFNKQNIAMKLSINHKWKPGFMTGTLVFILELGLTALSAKELQLQYLEQT